VTYRMLEGSRNWNISANGKNGPVSRVMNDCKGAVRVDVDRDFCGLQLQYVTISERNQVTCYSRQCSFLHLVKGG
jgi:hypothetical protein